MFALLALGMATKTANSACLWFTFQPELPDSVKKLRKF
ncbi:MAG: cyclic lactone autoinducer peptide [Oscillospiraceae bacterium]|nr:cyclic lactone autoinducer peptide [Oscillospiraceae bacterium]